jgi:hypothetical protein
MPHTGGCRCGAVRFSASAEPFHVSYCHCSDCRRAGGAPLTAFVGFASKTVEFAGDELKTFVNGAVTRSFCGICGSPIGYDDARLAGQAYFMLGAMDRPEKFEPALHAWVSEQLPYVHMNDGLPRLPGTSVPRPDGMSQ